MAADLTKLLPELQAKSAQLVDHCSQRGFEMRPNNGLRDPFEQARLWRQSRSIEEIQGKLQSFRAAGATFLAHCIESVGPQHGDHVTDAPPGYSWHQWGEALDCFWLLDGKAVWSTTKLVNGENAYKVYALEATKVGLFAGGNWSKFKDWPHVQLREAASPDKKLSVLEIDRAMRERFGSESAAAQSSAVQ